jgi:CRP-like cAMP-binding protein
MDGGDSFLQLLPAADREALLAAGTRRHLDAGEAVLHEGDTAHDTLVVVAGSLKITRTSLDGRELVVGVRTAGQLVGEVAAIDGRPRSASVWTLQPTQLQTIPVETFRRLLEEHPALALALLGWLCTLLRESADKVLEFGTQDALARVSRRLLELAPRAEGSSPAPVELGVSQQDLAARCGLSREAVVKALRVLRSVGWIRQEGRQVVLLDVLALHERGGLVEAPGQP